MNLTVKLGCLAALTALSASAPSYAIDTLGGALAPATSAVSASIVSAVNPGAITLRAEPKAECGKKEDLCKNWHQQKIEASVADKELQDCKTINKEKPKFIANKEKELTTINQNKFLTRYKEVEDAITHAKKQLAGCEADKLATIENTATEAAKLLKETTEKYKACFGETPDGTITTPSGGTKQNKNPPCGTAEEFKKQKEKKE